MVVKTFVCLALTARGETASWDFARKVLGVLHGGDAQLCPERAGHNESYKARPQPFEGPDDMLPLWAPTSERAIAGTGFSPDLYWKRSSPLRSQGSFGQTWINSVGQVIPSHARFQSDFSADFDFVSVFRAWCALYSPTQAYLHLFTKPEVLDSSIKSGVGGGEFGLGGSWERFRSGTFGPHRDQKTFNLGFLNYFPKDRFGSQVWDELAVSGIDPTPFGAGYLIQLAPSLQSIKDDFPGFAKRRIYAKRVMGEREFVISDEPPRKIG